MPGVYSTKYIHVQGDNAGANLHPRPQYRTGKTLGSGTYAVVKEAAHIKTGKYYACKVISKKLMEGREHMVRSRLVPVQTSFAPRPLLATHVLPHYSPYIPHSDLYHV